MGQGAKTKFGIHTTTPVTTAFEAMTFGLKAMRPHISAQGSRGTRSRHAKRKGWGVKEVNGPIATSPSVAELVAMLAWAGFLNTDGTFSLTEALTSRAITADLVSKVQTFTGCYVDALTISCSKNQPWQFTWDVIGQDDSEGDAGTFPAINVTPAKPLFLHESTFTLLGTPRSITDITIKISNFLEAQANNAPINELIEPADRQVAVTLGCPYTPANADLKKQDIEGDDAVLLFDDGEDTVSFNFGALQFPDGAVEMAGKSGIMLQLDGEACETDTDKELEIVVGESS